MNRSPLNKALFAALLFTAISISSKSQTNFIWGKQFGTEKDEYTLNHVCDKSGNIYVAGKTTGSMDARSFDKTDGFLTKIDTLGNIVWSKQFGTTEDEDVQWSAIDNEGYVYITGSTTGVLFNKSFGKEDIFLVKYNPDGNMEWSRQFGTEGSDVAKGIFVDKKGDVCLTGFTEGILGKSTFGKTDAFIMKLDKNGNQLYTTQFGTSGDDYSYSITGGPD